MTRLAFCFISNKINHIDSMAFRCLYESHALPYIIDSYTMNILTNPPIGPEYKLYEFNIEWKKYNSYTTIDYFSIRQDSLSMAKNADYIYVGDDDFFFFDSASEVINECCLYLKIYPDCGAIYLGANWGEEGKYHNDEIYITNKGHLNTNRGIIVRNRPILMDSRFHALGACEDWIIGFTCLMQGYYVARRLHVPIDHVIERNSLEYNHSNINYDIKFLNTRGIWAKIREVLGEWEDTDTWPKGIWKHYRQEAMVNGRGLYYDQDGNIM